MSGLYIDRLRFAAALLFAVTLIAAGDRPLSGQEVTGTPGSPAATTTITGKQLPRRLQNSAA